MSHKVIIDINELKKLPDEIRADAALENIVDYHDIGPYDYWRRAHGHGWLFGTLACVQGGLRFDAIHPSGAQGVICPRCDALSAFAA